MLNTLFVDLPPLLSAGGTITLPGSKSISNRVLLLAALTEGRTTLHDVLDSDDTRVMLAALRALGCDIQQTGNNVVIEGLGGQPKQRQAKLFMGNAGTAIRPLTAALALMGGDFELSGVPRMHERPIGDLVDALRQLGCQIDYTGQDGYPPLHIGQPGLKLDAPIQVRGDVSSQFLTALLMALPLVARQDIVIDVVGELISRPYIEITLNLLARFGIAVQRDGWQRFTIPAGSRYQSPGTLFVEADASSASYFIALGAIAPASEGHQGIRIEGLGADSIQGDIRFVEAAQMMGAQVVSGPNWLEVSRGAWPLTAIDLDCNHIPDAAMTLAVMALYANGTTTLRNIASWRVKETDRIAAMACELRKLGASVVEGTDFIQVTPPASPAQWQAASLHTYDDHRVAMCFALATFNPAGLPVRIEDPKCVAKTFPDFFESLFALVQTEPARIPVICVDGPTASGKGTLAAQLASRLGYHLLDSGALYRITALAATRAHLTLDATAEAAIAALAQSLQIEFLGDKVLLAGEDVSEAIRTEEAGMNASKVSVLPKVRSALVDLQHGFRRLPGLVADGRDMGTVIFPAAPLKVFLTASAEHRAQRRFNQLISKDKSITLAALRADLEARDGRDSSRSVAPLKPAADAKLLDNSHVSIEESVKQVLDWWQGKQPF
ncbi:bifunctional 3-phosphoshikimate 1-carboxyvinyltransferase/cytidylate kinase [Rhodoferax sp.]|uniref:bifunctional 3-phosphoshikimate 1-carboxyvinyltransferase/cytidylate kinase n=1 Tax=Rhodoferax sp. TaxID=50421 RepID=UPI002731D0AE|nr:bifunctional 3-phosphoshikimate 1-carboxyvinyltransferase/cytidylate kinase [Rhodoferax sp.]MDP1531114.1 bifunctional 3-phosphoshikimate 1-carboxyvinyltransferase/cytidylate kinase [Rhodoferax sp.]MDP1942398.1 bifunctional 3-phosphoshikimate 1-carboxyvinyltransferase/cytidylate kinase [Rhodoferax sp.]MDP2442784.1 bifunctional 3-phosphoshikimate 1-carboxyvinyltransferase/cytidylate kinase [Rhodoferax sp.]MDZ4207850.1 bifunctional 3-phosphoshikimate 1-carboxyvinyltransferase/cytidylate kinase 